MRLSANHLMLCAGLSALVVGAASAARVKAELAVEVAGVDNEGMLACGPMGPDAEFDGTGTAKVSVNVNSGKARIKLKGEAVNGSGETQKFKDSPEVLDCVLEVLGLMDLPEGVTIERTSYTVTAGGTVKGSAKGTIDPALLGGA